MKLHKLIIRGYKNLDIDLTLDEESPNYLTIIGLNGSGKSNVLEAIGIIFKESFFRNEITDFEFYVEYTKGDDLVKLDNKKMYINEEKRPIPKSNIRTYLPEKILACYSGEEQRLWQEVFSRPYNAYFYQIRKNTSGTELKFLYINKLSWDKALLTLLCHPIHQNYIFNLLNIREEDIKINIEFNSKYDNIYIDYTQGFNSFTNFISSLQNLMNWHNELIKIDTANILDKTLSITSLTSLTLGNIDYITQPTKWCQRLFNYLYLATMPRDKKIIQSIDIKLGKFWFKMLSEGQKKLILIECITRILSNEDTIILYDEPDSHIHLDKKQEIIQAIEQAQGTSLLTSHSPTLIKGANPQSLYKLSHGKLEKINELYEGLSHLVTQQDLQKIFFSTKDLIICEGKTDELYITKALEIYKQDYPNLEFEFILLGGTDIDVLINLLEKIANHNQRKIIILVDRDDAGLKVYNALCKEQDKKDMGKLGEVNIYRPSNYPTTIFLMMPVIEPFKKHSQFVLENYFGYQILMDLAKRQLEIFRDGICFREMPNNIQTKVKSKSLEEFCQKNANRTNMTGFRVLLDKLNEIVQLP